MLNSFWGKFGENLNKSSTIAVSTPEELYQVVLDPLRDITSVRICNEERLEIVYNSPKDECAENGKTNISSPPSPPATHD